MRICHGVKNGRCRSELPKNTGLEPPQPPILRNRCTVCQNALEATLRQGAQMLLQAAIDNEVSDYIQAHQHQRDDQGHRQVVRNGHLPEAATSDWNRERSCSAAQDQ